MNDRKGIFAVLLCGAMMFALLTGCGSQQTGEPTDAGGITAVGTSVAKITMTDTVYGSSGGHGGFGFGGFGGRR